MSSLIDRIRWFGHAGFAVRGGKVICFDPYRIRSTEKADLVLITHEHFDHCSPEDIQRIVKPETVIVTVPGNRSTLSPVAGEIAEIKTVAPGDTLQVDGVGISVVPAYNTNKDFHPKSGNWVGFVVETDGETVYHAGDTDLIPEMKSITCNIALLPVSGTYVMTADEAAQASRDIGPDVAVPMHYGDVVGDSGDADKFKSLCECEVRILQPEP